jgi:hypothetical protein
VNFRFLKGSKTMGIEDLLGSALGGDAMAKIASRLGTDQAGAQSAVSAALPALLGKLKANADDPAKGPALAAALKDHDGSALTHGIVDDDATGHKILGHVFGTDAEAAHAEVAEKSGLDKGKAAGLMAMLAPLVMGAMGKAGGADTAPQGLSGMLGGLLGGGEGGGGLGGLLGGLLGGAGGGLGGLLGGASGLAGGATNAAGGAAGAAGGAAGGIMGKVTDMLDQNNDGSIIDDVTRMATGGGDAATGGKGGILGKIMGMFGKK